MRTGTFLFLLLIGCQAIAQGNVVINELQASNRTTVLDQAGSSSDWIELYNVGEQNVDLLGMRLAISGRYHPIESPLQIAAKGHLLLWFSGHSEEGVDHVGFTLPKEGGTLLLIGKDGTSIMDLFTWQSLGTDLSIGRLPDGEKAWSYFEHPTPGNRNEGKEFITSRTSSPIAFPEPGIHNCAIEVTLKSDDHAKVFYTLDGSAPSMNKSIAYVGPISLNTTTVIRSMAYASGHLPSNETIANYVLGPSARAGIHLVMDPEDLMGDHGIYAPGILSNNTRIGRSWERPAVVIFPDPAGLGLHVGARINGSGSRGSEKRSFKLLARDRFDSPEDGLPFEGSIHFSEGILRADAGQHAFLRNRLLEVLVLRYGLAVDVQPSVPHPLYLNDRYWGLYRWMPPKNAEWLRYVSGSEAVDVLEGPAHVALNGSGARFQRAQHALIELAPLSRMDSLIVVQSLIDLACLDLWSGRADHDLNVRCYRPRQQGGKWRWVLFDMDLWAPMEENSVERMCSAAVPETPYLPQLLEHPELQPRFLARMCALNATMFKPAIAQATADSIFLEQEDEMMADHRRWELELGCPDPRSSHSDLVEFLSHRPMIVMRHLADHTGRTLRKIHIDVPSSVSAQILLEGLPLPEGKNTIYCFQGVPMQLEVIVPESVEFAGWKGTDQQGLKIIEDLSKCRMTKVLLRNLVP